MTNTNLFAKLKKKKNVKDTKDLTSIHKSLIQQIK